MAVDTIQTHTPENTSILQLTKFTFFIPDKPFLRYFCQTASIPAIDTNAIAVPNPHSPIYVHGEKINYEPLVITAMMDEDLRVYEETQKWMVSLARPQSDEQYARRTPRTVGNPFYFDGILNVNTNANNVNIRFKFVNCHPVAIGAVNFDTKVDADTIPTADFTFRYDYFLIDRPLSV